MKKTSVLTQVHKPCANDIALCDICMKPRQILIFFLLDIKFIYDNNIEYIDLGYNMGKYYLLNLCVVNSLSTCISNYINRYTKFIIL